MLSSRSPLVAARRERFEFDREREKSREEEVMRNHRSKSAARKPLGDISNRRIPRTSPPPPRHKSSGGDGEDYGSALDRLLLVRSDLASLIGQIDELVAQAIECKTISKKGSQDIDSFRHILTDMHSSLKPWFSRFQQTFATASTASADHLGQSLDSNSVSAAIGNRDTVPSNKSDTELELIVSPSPLVSWRAGTCTVDCGRQLFLLTPLPKPKVSTSKLPGSSKFLVGRFTNKEQSNCCHLQPLPSSVNNVSDDLPGGAAENLAASIIQMTYSPEQESGCYPLNFSNDRSRRVSMHLFTPSLCKSLALPGPVLEPSQQGGRGSSELDKSKNDDKVLVDLSTEEVSECFSSEYQDLFGLLPGDRFTSRRKEVDETLNWFLSPPKTCILMEPTDEKPLQTPGKTGLFVGTPICKGLESTLKSKQPGEATLKRELWTKFEAVSSSGMHFDISVFQKTGRKGFLDMLEEVSCETTGSDIRLAR